MDMPPKLLQARCLTKRLAGHISFVFILLTIVLHAHAADAECSSCTPQEPRDYGASVRAFGALGNGIHDDTAAIQAAIDHAYAKGRQGIVCPNGIYKISQPLFLDPPGNLRGSYAAWSSEASYLKGQVVSYDATGAGSDAIPWLSLANGNRDNAPSVTSRWWVPTTAKPSKFGFSLSVSSETGGMGSGNGGCRLAATFNNAVALWVGTGQRMSVRGIAVLGPSGTYAGLQNPSGVGIGLSGGSGGSSNNLIEDVEVDNFYIGIETDANRGCCLSDSNSFRKVSISNAAIGINIAGIESYIDDVQEPAINATVGIKSVVGKAVSVFGGNISAYGTKSGAFAISRMSPLSDSGGIKGYNTHNFTFTAALTSPDVYVGKVYNSYAIKTSHFGIVPLTMTNWEAATDTGTFSLWPSWVLAYYGQHFPLNTATDLQSELQAATMIFAIERATTFYGTGFDVTGVHVENNGCTTLLDAGAEFAGATTNRLASMFFDFDPGLSQYAPSRKPTPAQSAEFYCAAEFPFIQQEAAYNIEIDGGNFGQSVSGEQPVLIDLTAIGAANARFVAKNYSALLPNTRVAHADRPGVFYDPYTNPYSLLENEASGGGIWDPAPWPHFLTARITASYGTRLYEQAGILRGTFCGFHHCPETNPDLPPGLYKSVRGALGPLGSYPPIDSQVLYNSIDYNSPALSNTRLRSASQPGYSWGQDLTDASTGGTVAWSYKGRSSVISLDGTSMQWMFPGLGITINGTTYVVTGVYPALGYVTVWAPSGTLTAGEKTKVYSCSSACTIGQARYSWMQYP